MAGQGIERREILRILATAAAAAQFPGFSKWVFACGHVGNVALQIKPAMYRPQFFTAAEYAMVGRLAEMSAFNPVSPVRKLYCVAEFIDFMVASDPGVQYNFRTGLTGLNADCERTLGKSFAELSPDQQTSPLEPLAHKARPGEEDNRRFFSAFREITLIGFYTSEIGFKELDHPALKLYSVSPECPHKDDPEHLYLSRVNS